MPTSHSRRRSNRRSNSPDGGPELEPKEQYQKLLRAVEYNTGGPDEPLPAGMEKNHALRTASGHGRYDVDGVKSAIRQAARRDGLLLWRDRDDCLRLTLTDEESLKALVAEENARPYPDVDLIEHCRDLIQEARDD